MNETGQKALYTTIMNDLVGMMKSRAISLAAQLQLADLLKDGPKSLTELAEATGTQKEMLYRLLYALTNCGYFEEVEPEVFAQSERSSLLRTDIAGSLHDFAIMHGQKWQWMPWADALHTLQTGEPVFPLIFDADLYHYFQKNNPEAGQQFHRAMRSQSEQYDRAITCGYDYSAAGTILDVGGGQGTLLASILRANPGTRGILFDQPPVVALAQQSPLAHEFRDRLAFTGGNFFDAVPSGADSYILKQIMHIWEDAECIQILTNCRKAMNPGGRVLVIDQITIPGKKVPSIIPLLDLQLQLLVKGHKRSEAQHRPLFEEAGLRLTRVLPTESTYTILEATAL